jgi:hypothetical protein
VVLRFTSLGIATQETTAKSFVLLGLIAALIGKLDIVQLARSTSVTNTKHPADKYEGPSLQIRSSRPIKHKARNFSQAANHLACRALYLELLKPALN